MENITYIDDGRNWDPKFLNQYSFTTVNYAFGKIKNGILTHNFKHLEQLQQAKQANHFKLLLSIGGWSIDGFSDMALSKQSRQKFIDSVCVYLKAIDADGVDLDWEYPTIDAAGIVARAEDTTNFNALISEFKTALLQLETQLNKKMYLTIAIGAHEKVINTTFGENTANLVANLDWINVMTYDIRGSFSKKAGHHTNLLPYADQIDSAKHSIDLLLKRGIPAEKLVIGAAFYGRVWTQPVDGVSVGATFENSGAKTIDYTELAPLIKNKQVSVAFDQEAQAEYFYNQTQFISIDTPKSIHLKRDFIQKQGLGGIMFWEYSLDQTGDLFKALFD